MRANARIGIAVAVGAALGVTALLVGVSGDPGTPPLLTVAQLKADGLARWQGRVVRVEGLLSQESDHDEHMPSAYRISSWAVPPIERFRREWWPAIFWIRSDRAFQRHAPAMLGRQVVVTARFMDSCPPDADGRRPICFGGDFDLVPAGPVAARITRAGSAPTPPPWVGAGAE